MDNTASTMGYKGYAVQDGTGRKDTENSDNNRQFCVSNLLRLNREDSNYDTDAAEGIL